MTASGSIIIGRKAYDVINGELIIDKMTAPIDYGKEYLANYHQLSKSIFSIKLCQWRRAYAESWAKQSEVEPSYLDYGCGFSPIIANIHNNIWNEDLGEWYGTDCNLEIGELSHMQSRWIPPTEVNLKNYDVVCFFDVIEHLRNYKSIIKQIAIGNAIVITVPCWEDWYNINNIVDWRHFKLGEHFLYGSSKGWIAEITKCGFELLDHTTFETTLGRLDSHTMSFRKVRK